MPGIEACKMWRLSSFAPRVAAPLSRDASPCSRAGSAACSRVMKASTVAAQRTTQPGSGARPSGREHSTDLHAAINVSFGHDLDYRFRCRD